MFILTKLSDLIFSLKFVPDINPIQLVMPAFEQGNQLLCTAVKEKLKKKLK